MSQPPAPNPQLLLMTLSLIVAVAENGVIGRDGDLPWRLSADLQRFKRLTMGHAILMGRKTWESIGRPLPGRKSIVISRQSNFTTEFDEVSVVSSVEQALGEVEESAEGQAVVIGGAQIYALTLPFADRLLLTRVHAEVKGDVFFPDVNWNQWKLVEEENHEADERNNFASSFQEYQRADA